MLSGEYKGEKEKCENFVSVPIKPFIPSIARIPSLIIQSCSFQAPDQLAKQLTITQ
jgi:hypothetical protein